MDIKVREENGYQYIDEGEGEVLLLLHGLFGALSNWADVVNHYKERYRVVIPLMPLYEMPLKKATLSGLVTFVEGFVAFKELKNMICIGNSLGGHLSILYTLANKDNVRGMVLTGSSGLFEDGMGGSYPKRGNYAYVKEKVEYTFYYPETATKEVVDEVYSTLQSGAKCLRIISISRSAQKHNVAPLVSDIDVPTLLIWGLNDTITPPSVAHKYDRLMPNTVLRFIDKCGHAPMMEHPKVFNEYFDAFLEKLN